MAIGIRRISVYHETLLNIVYQPRQRRGLLGFRHSTENGSGHTPESTNRHRNGVRTMHSTVDHNWHVPAQLAHHAFRDPVADRLNNGGFFNGYAANNFRRGGAPYHRLQRLERALQSLGNAEEHWLLRRF
ncbi:hypothetical protein C8R44DRAFT_883480 [Mycena epipterygia]|nr:hypothetical protein C8R44DRAFT_883480 [Mycena epipterygia]